MNHPSIKKSALSVVIAASSLCSGIAQAQLEEVIVTAQKRAQSLQDVPMSVSALSSDTMTNAAPGSSIHYLSRNGGLYLIC